MHGTLYREQVVRASLADVWDYFSSPRNLDALTPPDMRFHIVTDLPEKMYAGQLIEYRISILPRIWLRWLTEIRHLEPGSFFVDEQRDGPYRFWYHEHRFEEVADGVRIIDRVTYSVGYGPLGWLLHKLFIRRTLRQIFDYRCNAVKRVFAAKCMDDR